MPEDKGTRTVDEAFAARFREVRTELGYSQEQVAVSMSEMGHAFYVTTVGKIERGDRRVSVGEAVSLAEALGVDIAVLLATQSDLAASYAVIGRTRDDFRRAMSSYVDSMVIVAAAADRSDVLSDRDLTWLREGLLKQTPGDLVEDAQYAATATITREGFNPDGEYVLQLLQAISDAAEWSRSRSERG